MEERGLAVARWWNIFQAFEKWWAVVSEKVISSRVQATTSEPWGEERHHGKTLKTGNHLSIYCTQIHFRICHCFSLKSRNVCRAQTPFPPNVERGI